MDLQRAAEVQVVLEGVSLPATRDELVRYAEGVDRAAARELERIPDREYERLDAVGEELASTGVRRPDAHPLPKPESGRPPGGDDYLNPSPESGAVRESHPPDNPPQRVLEQQTKTQKRQQAAQQG
jgi:hypothetical protein